jgi:hypothetical protein
MYRSPAGSVPSVPDTNVRLRSYGPPDEQGADSCAVV